MSTPQEKYHAAWIGASVLSICGSFQQSWISKAEYEEHGSNILMERL
jgi:actin-related protein